MYSAVSVLLLALRTTGVRKDTPRPWPVHAGDTSGPGPPPEKHYFVVTKNATFLFSLDMLLTLMHRSWRMLVTGPLLFLTDRENMLIKPVEEDAVFLKCKHCNREYNV
jgi:hypothetical protein